eukprot:tig00000237_g20491.t1
MRENGRAAAASRRNKNNSTFEQLQAVRSGLAKRTQTFECKEEEAIFDVVDEKRYEELKRQRGKEFVVDDEHGYCDDGEEVDWETAEHDDEEPEDEPAPQKGKPDAKKEKKDKKPDTGGAEKKIQSFFMGGANKPRPAPAVFKPAASAQAQVMGFGAKRKEMAPAGGADADKMLESMLAELDGPLDAPAPASKKPFFGAPKAAPPASAVKAPLPKKFEERPATPPVSAAAAAKGKAPVRVAAAADEFEDTAMPDAPEPWGNEPLSPPSAGAPKVDGTTARSGSASSRGDAGPTSPPPSQPSFPPKGFTSPEGPASPSADLPTSPTSPGDLIAAAKTGAAAGAAKRGAASLVMASIATAGYRMLGEGGPEAAPAEPEAARESAAAGPTDLPIEEDGSMKMYWIDAIEDKEVNQGRVYLFGKVKPKGGDKFVSCCVIVEGTVRNLFFLPREEYLADEGDEDALEKVGTVAREVSDLLYRAGIKEAGLKPALRNYAFEEEGVPRRPVYYVKVRCSQKFAPLPEGFSGKTFSRVFGTRTSALENLLLKRKLMGPGWIRIENVKAATSPTSWCKLEARVDDVKSISVVSDGDLETPALTALSLSIKTVMNPKTRVAEVVMVHGIVHPDVRADGPTPPASEKKTWSFAVVRKVDFCPFAMDARQAFGDRKMPVAVEASERALLSLLLVKMHQADADILVGHRVQEVDLDVLLHRLAANKVPMWSKLGRLKRSSVPRMNAEGRYGGQDSFRAIRVATAGRLICDTYNSARELLREKTYDLGTLARSQIDKGITLEELDAGDVAAHLDTSENLVKLLRHTEHSAYLAMQLMFQLMVVPLTKQLTNLAGNLWARSLNGARAERNEYLLLHEFHALKYIVPDKYSAFEMKGKAAAAAGKGKAKGKAKQEPREDEEEQAGPDEDDDEPEAGAAAAAAASGKAKRKPAYAGGLVLEPKRGLYDKLVLLLDFNSLYPSIIQEYNICFTTVRRQLCSAVKEEGGEGGEAGAASVSTLPDLPGAEAPPGVLPRVIRVLVDRRRQVKALIKGESDPHKLQQLDIRQKALKLTANSMYGCLGFRHSRFYAKPIAELITAQGRETLQRAVDVAQGACGLEVIYGDTDSVMIHTHLTEVAKAKEMGQRLKKEVNKLYRHLEIELDGMFARMLLLRKKKYAALKVAESRSGALVYEQEEKGLDLVRRDWCPLSVAIGRRVLGFILQRDNVAVKAEGEAGAGGEEARRRTCEDIVADIHAYLREVKEKMDAETYDVRLFAISKSLTRAPEEYPDSNKLPHVAVAKQLMAQGKALRAGEIIQYVVCATGTTNASLSERAYALDTVLRSQGGLKPDYGWYMQSQIHPPVARLCEPIEGTGAGMIAECLGMDGSKFKYAAAEAAAPAGCDEDEKFKACEPLRVKCTACAASAPVPGIYRLPAGYSISVADGDAKKLEHGYPFSALGHLCCGHCGKALGQPAIENALVRSIGRHIERYYEGWMKCAEAECSARARSCQLRRGLPACPSDPERHHLVEEYSAGELYTQLLYFQRLFDVAKAAERLEAARKRNEEAAAGVPDDMRLHFADKRAYDALRATAARYVAMSAYGRVNLADIFRRFQAARS